MVFAQTLSSSLEKKTIALGEPNIYTIRIEGTQGKPVEMAPKNELMPFHFEEIDDSITLQGEVYERRIEFTVFEEGEFTIPAFDVKIGDEVAQTVSYHLQVINTAQKGDVINDIMGNQSVAMNLVDYWELYKFYILGILAVLGLIFVVWQFWKYGRRRQSAPIVTKNATLKKLEQLKKKKYIETGDYRAFYVELIEISRNFLTQQYRIPADVLLTDDLIELMKNNQTISQENEAIVEAVFLRGDLVKFAKTFPDKTTMEEDWRAMRDLVKRSSEDLEFENLRKDV